MKYYTGIGSRETPDDVMIKMTEIAKKLSRLSYTLRSGAADGADTAFEDGAGSNKQIFLPWNNFNKRTEGIIPEFNEDMVRKYHPKPDSLTVGGWLLMSRNTNQVLGQNFDDPVEFVLCWTKDGKASGGTGQALRIAKDYNIPVFNFYYGYKDFAEYMIRNIMMDK